MAPKVAVPGGPPPSLGHTGGRQERTSVEGAQDHQKELFREAGGIHRAAGRRFLDFEIEYLEIVTLCRTAGVSQVSLCCSMTIKMCCAVLDGPVVADEKEQGWGEHLWVVIVMDRHRDGSEPACDLCGQW